MLRIMSDLGRFVSPPEGQSYIACRECGNVTTAPTERVVTEGLPYCVHSGTSIAWKDPYAITGWTRMVPAQVLGGK